ncbi:uncharacterized protein [Eurosta solidaginis]|uniref:uncharacterized protein n=1 Tax=Eurosta solidaginis TaxID=178769 RepID=UPI0035307401
MSLEHMIAAMSCMISTCGDNFTPAIQKNSVISNPLDDIWNEICKKQALEFDQKFTQLLKSQQRANYALDLIERSLNNLRTLSGQGIEVRIQSKREVPKNLNVLTQPQFNCNGSVTGLKGEYTKYPFPLFEVKCDNKKYGNNWILIAFIDMKNREGLNAKKEDVLIHGIGRIVNSHIIDDVNQYFSGLPAFQSLTTFNKVEKLLLIIYDKEDKIKKIIVDETNFTKEIRAKRTQLLYGSNEDFIALLQFRFGNILSQEEVNFGESGKFAIFLKCD